LGEKVATYIAVTSARVYSLSLPSSVRLSQISLSLPLRHHHIAILLAQSKLKIAFQLLHAGNIFSEGIFHKPNILADYTKALLDFIHFVNC
jgi:hypothetical protein